MFGFKSILQRHASPSASHSTESVKGSLGEKLFGAPQKNGSESKESSSSRNAPPKHEVKPYPFKFKYLLQKRQRTTQPVPTLNTADCRRDQNVPSHPDDYYCQSPTEIARTELARTARQLLTPEMWQPPATTSPQPPGIWMRTQGTHRTTEAMPSKNTSVDAGQEDLKSTETVGRKFFK